MWMKNSTRNHISSTRSRNHNLILYFIVLEITSKMFDLSTTIFIVFNLLQGIYATDTITLSDPTIEKNTSDGKLSPLHTTNVLPLILFPGENLLDKAPIFDLAKTLTMPVIEDGRIVEGTEFSSGTSNEQMFFCPTQNSSEVCLQPHKFEKSKPLECAIEAQQVLIQDPLNNGCGINNRGVNFHIGYEICPVKELEQYGNKFVQIFSICFDKSYDQFSYTIHSIRSPKLLQSKILEQERSVAYPYRAYNDDAGAPINQQFKRFELPPDEEYPNHKPQMLVPFEDMTFGLWRKTTYINLNLGWQHEKLIPLWNKTNDYVRVKAIQLSDENIGINIYTGQFYIPIELKDKKGKSVVWVKMITTVPSDVETNPIEGIAILMNNFLDDAPEEQNPEIITTMCDEDLCVEGFKKQFTEIKGRVRCCSLNNEEVRQLFGNKDKVKYADLKIPGINEEEIVS